MCAAGHRVVFDFDCNKRDLSHAENKLTGERTYFKLRNRVWELEVNIIPKAETEDILTKMQEQNVEELCPFDGAGTLAVSPEDPHGLWTCSRRPRARGSRRHGRGDKRTTKCSLIVTLHASPVPSVPEPCKSDRRGKNEKSTMLRVMCRTGVGAGHLWLDAVEATHTPDFEISFVSATTTIGIDYGHLEDKVTFGRAGGRTFSDPGHEVVDHANDYCRFAPVQGHSASLVCAGFGTSDCGNG